MSAPVDRSAAVEPVPRPPRGRATATTHVRGSALLLVGRLMSMGLGLVIQLLLVRLLAKEDFGAFAWALSVVTLVQAFVPLGLDRVDSRLMAVADERGDDRSLVGIIVGEALLISGLGTVVFVVVLLWHTHLGPGIAPSQTAANLLVIMVLLAPLGALDALVLATFATFGRSRSVFYRRYLIEPVLRLSAIVMVFAVGGGVYGLTVGYVSAALLGGLLYAWLLVRLLSEIGVLAELRGRIVIPMREMAREGFPLVSSTLIYAATTALPALVLGAVGTALEVAALRAALPLAMLSLAAGSAFAILYLPMVARLWDRNDRHAIRITYWRTSLWVSVSSFPALLLGVAFATPVTVTLLGERYASTSPILVVLTLGFWFQSAAGMSGPLLSVCGRRRYLLWANVGSLVLGGLACALLIPRFGPLGAAVATTITLVGASLLRSSGMDTLPPGFFDRHVSGPFAVMAAATVGCAVFQEWAGLSFIYALLVTTVVSLAVGIYALPYLDLPRTFPELVHLRVLGPVLARLATRRVDTSSNPYLGSGGSPRRRGVADADGAEAVALNSRRRDADFLFFPPTGVVRVGPVPLGGVEALLKAVPPGAAVAVALTSASRRLTRTRAALEARGLDGVELFWEAPRRSRCQMLVPLSSRAAVLVATRRHEGSARGVLLSRVSMVLGRCGLTWVVARDVIAIGRRGSR